MNIDFLGQKSVFFAVFNNKLDNYSLFIAKVNKLYQRLNYGSKTTV